MQISKELDREKRQRFSTAGENVVDDIVVLGGGLLRPFDELRGVLDGCDVIWWEVEVVESELVDHGVDFDNGRFDAVVY